MDLFKIFLETDKEPIITLDVAWGELSGSIHNQGDLIDLLSHYAKSDNVTNNLITIEKEFNKKIITKANATDVNKQVNDLKDDLEGQISDLSDGGSEKIEMLSGQVETLGNSVVANTNSINDINNKLNNDYYDKAEVDKKILDAMLSGEVELDSYLLKDDAESIFAKKTDIPTPYDDSALINKINSISGNVETLQTKSDETYTKDEVDELINNIPTGSTYDDTELRNKINTVSGDVETLKANSGSTSDVIALSGEVITLSDKVAGNTLKIENKADRSDLNGLATEEWVESKNYLTEHQKLKTINNQSLIGDGNITIQGGGAAYDDTELRNKINTVSGDVATLKTASGNTYTKTEADNKFATKGELPDLTNYYTKSQIDAKGYLVSYTETDPTVPSWAKQVSKPTYTASEVGALPQNDYQELTLQGTKEDGTVTNFTILVKK